MACSSLSRAKRSAAMRLALLVPDGLHLGAEEDGENAYVRASANAIQ